MVNPTDDGETVPDIDASEDASIQSNSDASPIEQLDSTIGTDTATSAFTSRICPTCETIYEDAKLISCPKDGAFLAVSEESQAGKLLDKRYELLELIGRGGMGSVYRARDILLKRAVAVKLLHKHLISSPKTIRRFQHEAQAASALSHANVNVAHDFGVTDEGTPFLVLDYLDGRTLAEVISAEQGGFELERFLRIFNQISDGLAAAHECGIVHRDIKPGNIMMLKIGSEMETACIMDFGIAKIFPDDEDTLQRLTRTGEIFGSPFYMSPEQVLGKDVDVRCDIYALGCVMYETLTGKPPHVGATSFETLTKHLNDEPGRISELRSDIASIKRLERVILKTLAKQPSDRYSSVKELREDLDRISSAKLFKDESQAQLLPQRQLQLLPHWFPLDSILKAGAPLAFVSTLVVLGTLWATTSSSSPQAKIFSGIAIIFLAAGILIFFVFLRIFGPAGTVHKLSLESYVPEPFRASQNEVLSKLTAPWRPGALTLGIFKQTAIGLLPIRRLLTLSPVERRQRKHVFIIGKAGTGKTTLLSKFLVEEIASDKTAVVIIDFTGDLSQQIREQSTGQPDAARYQFVDLSGSDCEVSLAPQDLLAGLSLPMQAKVAAKAIAFAILADKTGRDMGESSTQLLEDSLELLLGCGASFTDLASTLRSPEEITRLINLARGDAQLASVVETWKLYEPTIGSESWNQMILSIISRVEFTMSDVRLIKLLTTQGKKLSLRDLVTNRGILVLNVPRDQFSSKATKLSSVFLFCLIETLYALSKDSPGHGSGCSLFMDMIEKAVDPAMFEKVLRKDNQFDLFTFSAIRSIHEFGEEVRSNILQQQSLLCVFAPSLKDAELLAPIMFRVGHVIQSQTITNFFASSAAPTFQPALEDRSLHVDRLMGQGTGSYFAYLTGTVAGIFKCDMPQSIAAAKDRLTREV